MTAPQGRDPLAAILVVVLLLVGAVLLVVRLRAGRDVEEPPAGPAKGPAAVALAAAVAAAGLGCILYVQLERWSYLVGPHYVAEMFGAAAALAVLLGGLLLLVARRSAGAAAYCVGAAAGPVSLLAGPDRLDAMTWQLTVGLVLIGVAALILVAVLIWSVPARFSWPAVAGAVGCLLLLGWAQTAEPYFHVDTTDRWLLLALSTAIPAAVLWKGGMVTAGALLGAAAGSTGAQLTAVHGQIVEGSALLLGVAVLATLATGLVLARSAQDHPVSLSGRP